MSEKPEALRLAERLENVAWTGGSACWKAAAELRRLHAENERLKAERDEAVLAEREACARIVKEHLTLARFDERHLGLGDVRVTIGDAEELEAAIRERGQEPPR